MKCGLYAGTVREKDLKLTTKGILRIYSNLPNRQAHNIRKIAHFDSKFFPFGAFDTSAQGEHEFAFVVEDVNDPTCYSSQALHSSRMKHRAQSPINPLFSYHE